jgi:two-component system, cell cycle sensor histidine kinase and response regulator CckA
MGVELKIILVVEDDHETLNMLSRCLAAGGFDVLWARDGADALKLLERTSRKIDLVLADVVLPGIPAPEIYAHVSRKHPQARVVYVSAFDMDTVRSHGVDPSTIPFLSKPCEPSELIRVVQQVLEGPGSPH